MLKELGESLNINEIVYAKVTLFILRFIYNDKKSKTLAESRCMIWKRMKKKSTQRLPPDEDTLRLHILRCNYVIFLNQQYACPDSPESPVTHGWISKDGICLPRRYSNPALPASMFDLPTAEETEDEDEQNEEGEEEDGEEDDEEDEAASADDIIRDSDNEEDSETDEDSSLDE